MSGGWQPKGPFHEDQPWPPSGGSSVALPSITNPDHFTVRDRFAAAALTALITGDYNCDGFRGMAVEAYLYADAMLEARQR